jgi:hypothetical protein
VEHGLLIDGFVCDPEKAAFLGALLLNSTTLRFPVVELRDFYCDVLVDLFSRPALLEGCVRVRVNNYTHSIYTEEKVFFCIFSN